MFFPTLESSCLATLVALSLDPIGGFAGRAGVAGMAAFIAWSLALLGTLLAVARRATVPDRRWLAATSAAAFAAVLAIAIQTDAVGVPWLAIVLWWLAGAGATAQRD